MSDELQDKVARIACELGVAVKPYSLGWLAARVTEHAGAAEITDELIAAAIPQIKATRPEQFGASAKAETLRTMTAIDKLEHANALPLPKRDERVGAAPASPPLSQAKHAWLMSLTAAQRHGYAHGALEVPTTVKRQEQAEHEAKLASLKGEDTR